MHHLTAGNQEKSARSTRFISLSKDLSAKLSAFALASKQMGENECKLGLISFEHDQITKYDFTPVYTLHCSLIEQLLRHPALVKHTCSKGQMSRFEFFTASEAHSTAREKRLDGVVRKILYFDPLLSSKNVCSFTYIQFLGLGDVVHRYVASPPGLSLHHPGSSGFDFHHKSIFVD